MTRTMANGRIGSGALFVAMGLLMLVFWLGTEELAFAFVGAPIVVLGAAFIAWGVAGLRQLPAPPARPEAELKGQIQAGLGLLAVGVVVAGVGALLWSRPVMCDDREMDRGDSCYVSSSGGGHSESYGERLEGQQLMAGAGVGLGVLIGLGGLWWAASGEVARRRGGG